MPNWCENHLYIEATESEIQNILAAKEGLLNYMRPQPNQPEGDWGDSVLPAWYNWRIQNWGTKWDVQPEILPQSETALLIIFDSAWAPPIAAIRHWESQDSENRNFNLRYIEWGMCFCGEEDSDGTSYVIDIPTTVAACMDVVPAELDEEFGICDTVAQWETEEA